MSSMLCRSSARCQAGLYKRFPATPTSLRRDLNLPIWSRACSSSGSVRMIPTRFCMQSSRSAWMAYGFSPPLRANTATTGLARATGRQHDCPCLEHDELPAVAPVAQRATDCWAALQELLDGALHEHIDAPMDGVVLEGADHLEPGAVADVGQPRVAVPAEVALKDET